MDEAKLFETLGRKQALLEMQNAAYGQLLNLLAAVVSGAIDRSRVAVNLTQQTWSLAQPGERPALPSTINGLPVVVTAPAEEPPTPATEPEASAPDA